MARLGNTLNRMSFTRVLEIPAGYSAVLPVGLQFDAEFFTIPSVRYVLRPKSKNAAIWAKCIFNVPFLTIPHNDTLNVPFQNPTMPFFQNWVFKKGGVGIMWEVHARTPGLYHIPNWSYGQKTPKRGEMGSP